MEYFVRHRTTYRYLQDVSHSWHLAHLRPRATPFQSIEGSSVTFSIPTASRVLREDYFHNPCEWISIDEPHTHLEILAESRVIVDAQPERASRESLSWEEVRTRLENPQDDEERDVVQYLLDSCLTRAHSDIAAYGALSFPHRRPLLAGAMELMNRIHKDFRYDTTVTNVSTPLDKVFEIRAGVCQDLAHIGIAAMRAIGLPARYVSGYLSVWAPPFGWVDLDPTNDLLVNQSHVTACWGRDYSDVAPVAGIILGGHDHVVEVGVDVIPVAQADPELPHIAPESPAR
jgi:transglutaminase-like putative cysteine protease